MDNTEQLQKLAQIFNTDKIISKGEIEAVLTAIISILADNKRGVESIADSARQELSNALSEFSSERASLIAKLNDTTEATKKEITQSLQTKLEESQSKLEAILNDIKSLMPKDGKDANEEEVVARVLEQIKLPEYKDVVLDGGEEIVAKINDLPTEEEYQIDATHIKNLPQVAQIAYGGARLLSHMADVVVTDIQDNDVLTWDSATGRFVNEAQSGGGSGTPGGSNTQLQYNNAGAFAGITGATTNGTAVTFTTGNLIGADIKASGSGGLQVLSNAGTAIALFGAGGGANSTLYGGAKLDYATASTLAILDASKNLISADTATYPSLTELSYVKGVTSAIQTQLNAKGDASGPASSTDNAIARFDGTTGKLIQNSGVTIDDSNQVTVPSSNTTDGTGRLHLSTYERAVYPTHYGEVLRLDWNSKEGKPFIAFRDNATNPGTPVTKSWVGTHDYLSYGSASYTKSFTDANVNTSTDRLTVTSHGFTSGEQVKLWNSGGALPTGIAYLRSYYVKVIDANTLELYRGYTAPSTFTTLINITAATGGGTHYIDNVTLGNNPHKHFNIEVSDSTGAVQTRLEALYDLDTTFIRTASAHFVVNDGRLYVTSSDQSANKEVRFGLDETDVYTRWSIRQDNTAESGSDVGSDFRIVPFTDSGTAGTPAIFAKRSTGNVGIGNAAPAQKLDVTGNAQIAAGGTTSLYVRREATNQFASYILNNAGTDQWSIQLRNDATNKLYIRDNINGQNILTATQGATPAALASGTWTFGSTVTPSASDGAALGTTALMWSDLFLASGGVINFNNGNATLTHSAGLITSNVPLSLGTSNALTAGSIELGNASDTTLSRSSAGVLAVEGVVVPTISSTNTLTNKRITKRVGTTTSSATPTINTDNVDMYTITAQTVDITSFTTNLSGTPTDGQTLWIAITGTAARAITWGSSFEASTVALPTTTVSTNRLDVGFVWNAATSKWRCIASA